MSRFPYRPLGVAVALAFAAVTPLQAASVFADGTLLFDARLRFETVDDDAFADDAEALTLRSRLGWKSGSVHGLYLLVEAEDVRALRDDYNSTANGELGYPVVTDPEGSEWNQALLGWDSGTGTQLALGRQRLAFDNQRFVGNSGWRQNEQTFDAFSVNRVFGAAGMLRYAYLDEVHRVFGSEHPNPLQAEHDLDGHLLNLGWTFPVGVLSGYGYLVENEDLPATSTGTLGLRFAGSRNHGRFEWLYAAELATQQDWREAPSTGSVDYLHAEGGVRIGGHAVRLGTEQLGANRDRAFQTPLATAHAFNGWADRFVTTPVDGLDDRYVKFDGPLGAVRYLAAWHTFEAGRGGARYGDEIDLQIGWPFRAGWNAISPITAAMVSAATSASSGSASNIAIERRLHVRRRHRVRHAGDRSGRRRFVRQRQQRGSGVLDHHPQTIERVVEAVIGSQFARDVDRDRGAFQSRNVLLQGRRRSRWARRVHRSSVRAARRDRR